MDVDDEENEQEQRSSSRVFHAPLHLSYETSRSGVIDKDHNHDVAWAPSSSSSSSSPATDDAASATAAAARELMPPMVPWPLPCPPATAGMEQAVSMATEFVQPPRSAFATTKHHQQHQQHQQPPVSVCGHDCYTRLAALLRVFEHELSHLLCFSNHFTLEDSHGPEFKAVVYAFFRHLDTTHRLASPPQL